MKKWTRATISVLLALSVILITTTVVFAKLDPITTPVVWQDPEGTTDPALVPYSAEVVDTWQLPAGIETTDKQLTVPLGFPADQIQFGGKALKVGELAEGKTVTVCFDFPVYRYDWSGSVYMWDGSEWVKQATTIATTDGSTQACAKVTANGYYALLIQFWGTPVPAATLPPV
jgi:hypothetical protein